MAARATAKTDPFTSTAKENDTVGSIDAASTEVSVTLKAGAGFNAPWIVVRGANVSDALDQLSDDKLPDLMEKSAKAAVHFGTLMPATEPSSSGGSSGGGGSAGARQDAPSGQTRTCKHGQMQYRSGSKNGRTWEAFMCPTPKGTADQCKAEFL